MTIKTSIKTESPAKRLELLRTKGQTTVAKVGLAHDITIKPSWYDEDRFKHAQKVIAKCDLGIQFSSFTGLLLILQLPEGLEPLLTTGNSKDLPALYKRYLSTIIHVRSWYEGDIFDVNSKAHKSIQTVRSMHRRVAKLMNEKFKVPSFDGKERVWCNQYDMALTQWAFIGLAMVYPAKCGLIAASIEELELINYCWRVLGYMMGMDDEFNACAYDSYNDIQEYMSLILEQDYKQQFEKLPCQTGLDMTKGIVTALKYYMPLLTFNVMAQWWAPCFMFNGYKIQPLTTREKVLYSWMKLSFNQVLKISFILRPLSNLNKRQFERRLKNRDKQYNKIYKKYSQGPCFLSDRLDYFGNNETQNNVDSTNQQLNKNGGVCPFMVTTSYDKHFSAQTVTNDETKLNCDLAKKLAKPETNGNVEILANGKCENKFVAQFDLSDQNKKNLTIDNNNTIDNINDVARAPEIDCR